MERLERKQETRIVKAALLKAGYQDVSVRHGTGTAWGWLHANVSKPRPAGCSCIVHPEDYGRRDTCELCLEASRTARHEVTELILSLTDRPRGDYDGNTLVEVKLK